MQTHDLFVDKHRERTYRACRMSELDTRAIIKRIEQARRKAGLSQSQIADVLELSERAYQNYEDDRVPFRRLGAIAAATNTNIRWLLHGTEEPPNAPEILQRIDDLDAKITDVQKEMRRQGVRRLGATAARKNDGGTGSKRPPKPKRPDESES